MPEASWNLNRRQDKLVDSPVFLMVATGSTVRWLVPVLGNLFCNDRVFQGHRIGLVVQVRVRICQCDHAASDIQGGVSQRHQGSRLS